MITGLEISSLSKDTIEMSELTKNTIILFNNWKLKNKFVEEFMKIQYDETELESRDIVYCTIQDDSKAKEQDHKAVIKQFVTYRPTSIYKVDNEQRFIFTVEAPFILQCTCPDDLWFCGINKDNEIDVYPFTCYKGHKETWNKGIEEVYREIISGRFGYYEEYGK